MTEGIWDIVDRQGWNETTLQRLLFDYLETHGLEKQLERYLAERAKEENRECASST